MNKTKVRKYKGGGYVKETVIDDFGKGAVTYLEMNPKGWYEQFAKPLIGKKKAKVVKKVVK